MRQTNWWTFGGTAYLQVFMRKIRQAQALGKI